MRRTFGVTGLTALLWAAATRAQGPEAATAAPPAKIEWEVGFEERVRSEALDDVFDWNDASDDHTPWYRFRTRLWGKAKLGDIAEVSLGLNNESRRTVHPDPELLVLGSPWKGEG